VQLDRNALYADFGCPMSRHFLAPQCLAEHRPRSTRRGEGLLPREAILV
jgi:hypothetical protein